MQVNFKAKGFDALAPGVTNTFAGPVQLNGGSTTVTPDLADNSTKIATTEFVKGQNYLTASSPVVLTGDVSSTGFPTMVSTLATIAGLPTGAQGSATQIPIITVDTKGRVTSLTTSALSFAWNDLTGKPNTLSGFGITDALPLSGGTLTGNLVLAGDPTLALHPVTKQYLEQYIGDKIYGLDPKGSVRVATTANVTLAGLQTVDDIALVDGDSILVKDQFSPVENGIYVVHSGAWVRRIDADSNAKVTSGLYCFVEEGTSNANAAFLLTTPNPIDVGVTPLTFIRYAVSGGGGGGGSYTAGAGIVINGSNVISLATTGIAAGVYGSATKIPALTIDSYGRVTTVSQVDLTPSWTNVTGKPTTLSGYGITDAVANTGGTFTGNITVPEIVFADGKQGSASMSISAIGSLPLFTFPIASTRVVKVVVQISQGALFEACELLVMHNDTIPYVAEYARMTPNGSTGISFDTSISAGNLSLMVSSSTVNPTTVKAVYQTVNT